MMKNLYVAYTNRGVVVVDGNCVICDKHFEFEVSEDDYYRWKKDGEYVQNAFPTLDASLRELLLSGMCGTCWDETWINEE